MTRRNSKVTESKVNDEKVITVNVPDDMTEISLDALPTEKTLEEIAKAEAERIAKVSADQKIYETGTNSTDEVALAVAEVLNNNTDEDASVKWSKILKLATGKVDQTTIQDLSLLSDAEIMRRLRLLWSKRVAAKKANDLVSLADIAEKEAELQSHRTAKTTRRSNVVSADTDPTTLSQDQLNKLIRNVQSKKCSAKKANDAALVAELQIEEDKLKAMRTNEPAAPKGPSPMSQKIAATIAELEKLPASDVVAAQIEMLKALM